MFRNEAASILGIDITASLDVAQAAFRKLAIKNHPDKGGSHEAFCQLNEAFDVFKNSTSREQPYQEAADFFNEIFREMYKGASERKRHSHMDDLLKMGGYRAFETSWAKRRHTTSEYESAEEASVVNLDLDTGFWSVFGTKVGHHCGKLDRNNITMATTYENGCHDYSSFSFKDGCIILGERERRLKDIEYLVLSWRFDKRYTALRVCEYGRWADWYIV